MKRNPWPWAIAGGLAIVVGVNVWVVRIAAADPPLVVTEKPYEVGEAYERELQAFRDSAALGYRAEIEAAAGRVEVRLSDAAGQPVAGLSGKIALKRAERADRDQSLTLAEVSPGRYEARGDLNPAGLWRLRTELSGTRGTWLDERRLWVSP